MLTDKCHSQFCHNEPSNTNKCPHCNRVYYCSSHCMDTDYPNNHIYTCVQFCPFIKDSRFLSDEEVSNTDFHLKIGDFLPFNLRSKKNNIIGKGSYGEVQLMMHKDLQKEFAVKVINKKKLLGTPAYSYLKEEVYVHRKLIHENIIRLYSHIEDEKNAYLILEYASKGSLYNYIQGKRFLSESDSFFFFKQALSGIYFLHTNGYAHRDIKPENMVITEEGILKICDFGWCTRVSDKRYFYYQKIMLWHFRIYGS